MKKKAPEFDFTRALARGHVSYDAGVGQWWESQAADLPHRRAYRWLAEYTRDKIRAAKIKSPLIVDFACGGGFFLLQLADLLPEARLVGLDGSHKLLALAQARLQAKGVTCAALTGDEAFASKGPRVRLVQTKLPNFNLPQGKADAVAFVFPNIAPSTADLPVYDRNGFRNPKDVAVATLLSRYREMDPEDEVTKDDPATLYDGFLTDRVVARNIRSFLKPGGLWFKVDYANAARSELSQLTQWRSLFCEGALEEPIGEKSCDALFSLKDNVFKRSGVILDVYHQTKDPSDKTGGYFMTMFEARKSGKPGTSNKRAS